MALSRPLQVSRLLQVYAKPAQIRKWSSGLDPYGGAHMHGSGELWQKIFKFFFAPAIAYVVYTEVYAPDLEKAGKRPPAREYEYMRIRSKVIHSYRRRRSHDKNINYFLFHFQPAPWGTGERRQESLFHNPGRNAVPGKGYTEPDAHLSFFYYQKMFFQQLFGHELDPPEARAHHDDH